MIARRTILFLIFFPSAIVAQEKVKMDSIWGAISEKSRNLVEQIDSVARGSVSGSEKVLNKLTVKTALADSLNPAGSKADSLKSLADREVEPLRSVSSLHPEKLSALQIKASSKLDSIRNRVALPVINLPVSDALKQSDLPAAGQKANGLATKVRQKADSVVNK